MMMRPRDSNDQRLLSAQLTIDPEPFRLHWIHDVFDNCVAVADFRGDSESLRVESRIVVEHRQSAEPEVLIDEDARRYPFSYDVEEMPDLSRCIERRHPDRDGEIDRWARRFVNPSGRTDTGAMLMTLTYAIKESFVYQRRTAQGNADAASDAGAAARLLPRLRDADDRGGARPWVWPRASSPAISMLRSGDGEETRIGGGSTHAWCQVYLPGAGWVEFDPTNGIIGSRDLIRVAVASDARQAIPLHGTFFGPASAFEAMDGQRGRARAAGSGRHFRREIS